MPTCLARYTTLTDKLYFGDGKHRFYIERCCGATCEGQVCPKCSVKNQVKVQDCRTFDHGFVGGVYPAKSQMYDSPYYHASVLKYGAPTETDLEKAMEAKRKAQGGTASISVPAPVIAPPPEQKKPRGRPKSSANALVEAAPEQKKPRAPRKKVEEKPQQIVAKPAANPVVHTLPQEGMVESMDDPLVVRDVIRIVLKPFTHGSSKYWRDSDREKLYSCTKDGKKGGYVGRWDSSNNCIVKDAYDSDED